MAVFALIAAGALEAWTRRHNMAPDGISYLDVASAYRAGDFKAAINEYWSPMFSWILACTVLIRDSRATLAEPAKVHALMFGFFLLAFVTLNFAIREAYEFAQSLAGEEGEGDGLSLLRWRATGYALFAWGSLELISLETVNPDILVSAFVYLLFALMLRVARGDARTIVALSLGLALGGAYLAKTVMFLVGLVSLCVAAVLYSRRLDRSRAIRAFLITLGGFVVVAGPWIGVLSAAKGHLTFGSSGKLNYAWLANGVPICCWQGGYGAGQPLHPPREILQSPPVYEFATPIRHASFPLWYDPAYWYEGVKTPVSPVRALSLFIGNIQSYLPDFGWLLAIFIVGGALARGGIVRAADWRYWTLFLLALAPFGLYGLVYTETRFLGGSAVMVCLVFLAGLRPLGRAGGATLRALTLAFAIPAVAFAGFRAFADLRFGALNALHDNSEENFVSRKAVPSRQPASIAIASAFHARGIPEGTYVATMGDGSNAYWARLAHVEIVSEMQPREAFWGNESAQQPIIDAMRRAGAQLIVADDPPAWADTRRWEKIPGTNAVMLDVRSAQPSR